MMPNLITTGNTPTMTSLELVDFLNKHREQKAIQKGLTFPCGLYTRLVHYNFMAKVPKVLGVELAPKFLGANTYENGKGGTQTRDIYILPKREACLMAMSYSYELQAAVFDHMTALEAKLSQPVALPSYAETLRLYADQIEQTQRVTAERDNAIATKALIGSKREATAMATASQAVKKANGLERELDRAKDYCTVKRMSMVHHGQPFDWRTLKSASNEMGIESIDVFDQNYGTVKAYHSSVWLEVYGLSVWGEC